MQELSGFLSDEVRRCPFGFYQRLRETAPVTFLPDLNAYAISRYDLVMEVVRNTRTFSNKGPKEAAGAKTAMNYCAKADELLNTRGFGRPAPTLANNDPPSHTAFRKLLQETFRVSRIRQMTGYVSDLTERFLDELDGRAEFDVIEDFAIPLPMYVIADQLGIARADRERFKAWSEAYLYYYRPPKTEPELMADAELVLEAQTYMARRMAERRAAPRDDILSELVTGKLDGERLLTDKEIMSMVEFLLVAGNETTTNGISNGIYMLAVDPALQAQLRADASLIPAFVEECLRLEAPSQANMRTTTEEVVVDGVTIPAGKNVLLVWAASNRDDGKFPHPDEVDLHRPNGGAHLAFGSGVHHCVGSELARVEMRVALEAFLRRIPAFELATRPDQLAYHYSYAGRGLISLPIRLREGR